MLKTFVRAYSVTKQHDYIHWQGESTGIGRGYTWCRKGRAQAEEEGIRGVGRGEHRNRKRVYVV